MSDPGVAAALADLAWRAANDPEPVGSGFLGAIADGMLAASKSYVDHLGDYPAGDAAGDTSGWCGAEGCSGACAPPADQRSRTVGTCRACGGRLIESEVIRAVRRGTRPVCGECWRAGAA